MGLFHFLLVVFAVVAAAPFLPWRGTFSSPAAWSPRLAKVSFSGALARFCRRGLQGPHSQTRSLSQRRSGHDEPYQHGEVFVTDDGAETDLDLGHYERFTGVSPARRQHHHRPHLSRHHRQGAPRRLSGRDGAGDPARHQRDQGFRLADNEDLDFVLAKSAAPSATLNRCRSSRRSASCGQRAGARATAFVHVTLVPYIRRGRD
jgi:hypothetical protein